MIETEIISVRYWASAREAAGTDAETVEVDGPVSLLELRARLTERHPDPAYARVLGVCSVLLGDRPVKGQDPAEVTVEPGTNVEFLPPFAGG